MERYPFEKAYEEAAKMQDKVKKSEAKNYYDAERLVDKDTERSSRKKEYEKNFGHEYEHILIRALKKVPFIEKVEHGTRHEDEEQGADLWLIPKGMDEPIAVQMTSSSNDIKLEEKRKKSGSLVRKEKREDAEINWDGNVELVSVEIDKRDVAHFWKTYEERVKNGENINPEDAISKKMIIDFFSQVIKGVNPAKRKLLMENMKKLANL